MPFTQSKKGKNYIEKYKTYHKCKECKGLDKSYYILNGDLIKSTMDIRAKKGKYNHRDILDNDIMNLEDNTPQYMPNISDNNFIKGLVKVHDREIAIDAILLDQGAVGSSRCYISKQLEKLLVDSGVEEIADNCKVCIPNGFCSHITKAYVDDCQMGD